MIKWNRLRLPSLILPRNIKKTSINNIMEVRVFYACSFKNTFIILKNVTIEYFNNIDYKIIKHDKTK